jgi:hypothetical protein
MGQSHVLHAVVVVCDIFINAIPVCFTRIPVFALVSVGFFPFLSCYTAFCFILKQPHLIVFICIPKSSNVLVKVTMCFQNGFSLVNGRSKFMAVSKPPKVRLYFVTGCLLIEQYWTYPMLKNLP